MVTWEVQGNPSLPPPAPGGPRCTLLSLAGRCITPISVSALGLQAPSVFVSLGPSFPLLTRTLVIGFWTHLNQV